MGETAVTDSQTFTEVLLEPVFVDSLIPQWLPRGVGMTLSSMSIQIRVRHHSGPKPRRIEISDLRITMPHVYEHTFGNTLSVDLPTAASWAETPPLLVVFPVSGLYMVEASVSIDPPNEVRCLQRLFGQDTEGRGWSAGEPTNRWHAPIVVADRVLVEQTGLSMRVACLTTVMTILTGVLLVNPLLDLVRAIARLRFPGHGWLNAIGLSLAAAASLCLAAGSSQQYSSIYTAKPGERSIGGVPESLFRRRRRQVWLMSSGYILLGIGFVLQLVAQFVR